MTNPIFRHDKVRYSGSDLNEDELNQCTLDEDKTYNLDYDGDIHFCLS